MGLSPLQLEMALLKNCSFNIPHVNVVAVVVVLYSVILISHTRSHAEYAPGPDVFAFIALSNPGDGTHIGRVRRRIQVKLAKYPLILFG
tara:strand:- start:1789 stop:2055 length:267 start_codon:yes stop_codon:yes gene_type:complete